MEVVIKLYDYNVSLYRHMTKRTEGVEKMGYGVEIRTVHSERHCCAA